MFYCYCDLLVISVKGDKVEEKLCSSAEGSAGLDVAGGGSLVQCA